MTTVCLVNRKGGVGKTTLTLALADFLSTVHGYRILIVDLDPQTNATLALIGERRWYKLDKSKRTIADLFEKTYKKQEIPTKIAETLVIPDIKHIKNSLNTLALLPGTPRLQEIGENMMEGDSGWRYYAGSPYFILHSAFSKRIFSQYDYVFIDCPPALGVITMNGLTAANGYLIPTIPDHVSTIGISQVIGKIKKHSEALRRSIKLYGTIINRFKTGTLLHQSVLEELQYSHPTSHPIWNTKIPDTVKAGEAYHSGSYQMTLKGRYGETGHNYYQALRRLSEEFLRRIS